MAKPRPKLVVEPELLRPVLVEDDEGVDFVTDDDADEPATQADAAEKRERDRDQKLAFLMAGRRYGPSKVRE